MSQFFSENEKLFLELFEKRKEKIFNLDFSNEGYNRLVNGSNLFVNGFVNGFLYDDKDIYRVIIVFVSSQEEVIASGYFLNFVVNCSRCSKYKRFF